MAVKEETQHDSPVDHYAKCFINNSLSDPPVGHDCKPKKEFLCTFLIKCNRFIAVLTLVITYFGPQKNYEYAEFSLQMSMSYIELS